jgi:DNA polymerase-3 subunit gamma/tau
VPQSICTFAYPSARAIVLKKEMRAVYQALYRKYRPTDFDGVCGQPQVVRTLRNQVSEGRISHAYLFTGSRGTGKTSCAKILAKAVNCLSPHNGNPCNECEICRGINDETILDIIEIDAASNNGVDDIRELREGSAFTPAAARYRVYIIDEVHMLSGPAFNALLKTLEEPPEHVIFILATTEVHKLPATILSRCQRYDFRRISAEDIADRLEYVAGKEGFGLTRDAAVLIGKLSDGAMRDALSLLDVCSTAGDVDEQTVLDCAGLSGRQHLYDLLKSCFCGDSAAALDIIDKMYTGSKDLGRLCAETVEYLRDMMLIKSLRQPEKLLKCPQSELEQMRSLCDGVRLDTILHAMELFESTAERMRSGAERRTAVERAVIMLCDPSLDSSVSALLRRVTALECGTAGLRAAAPSAAAKSAVHEERPLPTGTVLPKPDSVTSAASSEADDGHSHASAENAPAKENQPHTVTAQENEPQTATSCGQPDAADDISDRTPPPEEDSMTASPVTAAPPTDGECVPFDRWNEVVAALGKTDRLMKAALGGSEAFVHGEYMLIKIANESFRDMINGDARHRSNLKAAIAGVSGINYKIGPYREQKAAVKTENDPLDKLIESAKQNNIPTKP